MKRGEIYWVNLGVTKGSVQGGKRPALIISNNINNKFSPTVNIIPITSKRRPLPVHVELGENEGLKMKSHALTEQETTVSKCQLGAKIGRCSSKKMQEIELAILKQKDINIVELVGSI